MLYKRRLILRALLGFIAGLGALPMLPKAVLAKLPKAFSATTTDAALMDLYGNKILTKSDRIELKLPEIAENGAVVPISVKTDLPAVKTISILAEKNAHPLAASFMLPEGTAADVSIRIRLAETMSVQAVVETDEGLYRIEKEVKVVIGGCSG